MYDSSNRSSQKHDSRPFNAVNLVKFCFYKNKLDLFLFQRKSNTYNVFYNCIGLLQLFVLLKSCEQEKSSDSHGLTGFMFTTSRCGIFKSI